MLAFRALSTLAVALLSAQTANAWLLEFWGTQNSCQKPKGSAADSSAGGEPNQTNECMEAYYDMNAIMVNDWDDGCKLTIYDGSQLICKGEIIEEFTKDEARDQEKLVENDDGNYMCLTDLGGHPGPYYASYVCDE